MGRWSRCLAPLLIDFVGLSDGERVLDLGCGTGSLTFALPRAADVASVTGIDFARPYVEHARAANRDPRIILQQGDASAMPFEAARFDRAIAMLSFQFVPQPDQAVAEMRRVVRPGGIAAATVWDSYGGMPSNRMFWDVAGVLNPDAIRRRGRMYFNPIVQPGGLGLLWRRAGLADVRETSLLVRMDYANFDDYWQPIASGEASLGQYHASLDGASQRALRARARGISGWCRRRATQLCGGGAGVSRGGMKSLMKSLGNPRSHWPAPSHMTKASASRAIRAVPSLRCSVIASALTGGMMIVAPTLRLCRMTPNRGAGSCRLWRTIGRREPIGAQMDFRLPSGRPG